VSSRGPDECFSPIPRAGQRSGIPSGATRQMMRAFARSEMGTLYGVRPTPRRRISLDAHHRSMILSPPNSTGFPSGNSQPNWAGGVSMSPFLRVIPLAAVTIGVGITLTGARRSSSACHPPMKIELARPAAPAPAEIDPADWQAFMLELYPDMNLQYFPPGPEFKLSKQIQEMFDKVKLRRHAPAPQR
jgi:hypothetical protein